MALNFLKHNASNRSRRKPGNDSGSAFATFGIFLALCGVAILSFFSAGMALLALGFTTLGSYMFLNNRRQNNFEETVNKDITTIRKNHDRLAGTVARQQMDIEFLQKIPPKKETPVEMEEKLRAEKPLGMSTPTDDSASVHFSDMVVSELVHHAVQHERIDMFIQPIVRLPQRKKRYFEMYARIRARAGVYLPAERYMPFAQNDNLVTEIDNLLLLRCLHLLKATAQLKKAAPFFVNIAASSLKNTLFMKDLLQFVGRHRALAQRLIFEIRHEDFNKIEKPVLQVIEGLGKIGCSFSLDHVKQENLDIALLQKYKIRFVKLDAKKMLAELASERRFNDMMKFKRRLEANGIGVIAEKIEDEHTLKELLDYDLHYGQGYLFGKPDVEGAYQREKVA